MMTTKIPEWQIRVIAEKEELSKKVTSLGKFVLESEEFDKLTDSEKIILMDQLIVMEEYEDILNRRLQNFNRYLNINRPS